MKQNGVNKRRTILTVTKAVETFLAAGSLFNSGSGRKQEQEKSRRRIRLKINIYKSWLEATFCVLINNHFMERAVWYPKNHFDAETLFYSAFHKTFDKRFPEFATNLARIVLRICQSNRALQIEVVNLMLNFVGKLRSSRHSV